MRTHVAEQARNERIQAARSGLAAFTEFVMRDERTAQPIYLTRHQRKGIEAVEKEALAVIETPCGSGATTLYSLALPLFTLGRNTSARVCVVTAVGPDRIANCLISRMSDPEDPHYQPLLDVFPGLRFAEKRIGSFDVIHKGGYRYPSFKAIRPLDVLVSSRFNLIIVDNVESRHDPMPNLIEWFDLVLLSRLENGGRVVVLGERNRPGDFFDVMAKRCERTRVCAAPVLV